MWNTRSDNRFSVPEWTLNFGRLRRVLCVLVRTSFVRTPMFSCTEHVTCVLFSTLIPEHWCTFCTERMSLCSCKNAKTPLTLVTEIEHKRGVLNGILNTMSSVLYISALVRTPPLWNMAKLTLKQITIYSKSWFAHCIVWNKYKLNTQNAYVWHASQLWFSNLHNWNDSPIINDTSWNSTYGIW